MHCDFKKGISFIELVAFYFILFVEGINTVWIGCAMCMGLHLKLLVARQCFTVVSSRPSPGRKEGLKEFPNKPEIFVDILCLHLSALLKEH